MGQTHHRQQYQGQHHSQPRVYVSPYPVSPHLVPQYRQQANQSWQEQSEYQSQYQGQHARQQGQQQASQQGQQQAEQQGQQQARQQGQQQAEQHGQQQARQVEQQGQEQAGQQRQQTEQQGQQQTRQQGQPHSGQSYQQYSAQPGQYYMPYQPPPYVFQYPESAPSAQGQTYSHQSEPPGQSYQSGQQQSGQYSAPTGQQPYYIQPYYIQPQPAMNQNVPYMQQYSVPPPSAQGSSMVRPGRRPHQQEQLEPVGWRGFQDKNVRAVFVRKVYTILMIQLLFTLGVIALFVFESRVKAFVQENKYLYFISLAVFVAVYLGMACFQSVRRNFPMNIIVLAVFTLAMSYMLGTISSYHETEGVFMAVGICAAVCLFVSVFSFYTKFDFTSCGGILCILLMVLILFGLIAFFLPSRTMTIVYASVGALVFTLFLAYDTQMMMGGKEYELSPEEHIFAAVQLYVDIVYIFMFLLMLLGGRE